jgi:tetratricopeptide (TPR) repeat protein
LGRLRRDTVVARARITKKKLKQPDEFVTWGAEAANYALAHIGYIVLAVFLAAAIIVAIFLWRQHQAASEEMAYTLLGKGIALYHQQDKREEASSTFSQLIKDYPGTKGGEVALLYRGRCYMLQKDYDRAVEDFKLFLKRSSTPSLRAIALNALGNSYWAKDDYRQAIDYFQQVLALKEEWLKPYVLLNLGMCWEKLGDKQKAVAAYQQSLKEELPSPWGELVQTRLKRLGGKAE